MRVRFCLVLLFVCIGAELLGSTTYCFRVYLKDKGSSGYTLDRPEAFLSEAALVRRQREAKEVGASDLPISRSYVDSLASLGAQIITQSKWFSTVVVASEDSLISHRMKQLGMVDSVKWIWKGERVACVGRSEETARLSPENEPIEATYGYAEKQIEMLNGIKLHEAGYRGNGMRVAVIDAGFLNVDRMSVFASLHLLGTHNAVFPGESVFVGDDHGTKVLSCLAANAPGVMVGTAPEASYWLIKSEDGRSEYPIEEDYWTAAVEFADSVGVHAISSSLGYFTFDAEELNYNQSLLDGKTAFISRAAQMAADKGMLLFCSAGNEGGASWNKITFPGDALDVLTVGAITQEQQKSSFSSVGFTTDYRVKPDVVALGTSCTIIDSSGSISYGSGTSFATPILSGLGICLWQALPWLSNLELIALLQRCSSQYKKPDIELGYGMPDVYKALNRERKHASRLH